MPAPQDRSAAQARAQITAALNASTFDWSIVSAQIEIHVARGTYVAIGVGLPDAEAQVAIEAGFAAIAGIHRLMSFHEPLSDVSRTNRAGGGTVRVDPHTYAVLAAAQHLAEASDGIFDITVAPDLVAWGFLPRPDAPRHGGECR